MYTWVLEQIQGIVEALSELYEMNCRHGDLKPENILHFIEDGSSGRLVISDVGLAKIHMKITNARVGRTSTAHFTQDYEAPDQVVEDGKPLSRKFDSWSLGCIMLEFIIWLLYGADEIKKFQTARETRASDYKCWFYEIHEQTVVVHGAVNAQIDSMQRDDPRCKKSETAIGDLLCIVKDKLLQIESKNRAEPKKISEDIKFLIQNACDKNGYMFKEPVAGDRAVCRPSISLTGVNGRN
ncbi:kinase-like domain-containing protein [Xylaria castorea]|nr:kinase-like domain-containing protein [Xylaria castorea]